MAFPNIHFARTIQHAKYEHSWYKVVLIIFTISVIFPLASVEKETLNRDVHHSNRDGM